jgi:integrase
MERSATDPEKPLESCCIVLQLVLSYWKTPKAPLHGVAKLQCPGRHNDALHRCTVRTTPSVDRKISLPANVDRLTRDGWRPRLRARIPVMRWLGLAIADTVSLKRSELIYDEDTGFWCVDTDRQKTGTPVYVSLPQDVYEELIKVPPGRGSHPEYSFLNPYNNINSETARWQRRYVICLRLRN